MCRLHHQIHVLNFDLQSYFASRSQDVKTTICRLVCQLRIFRSQRCAAYDDSNVCNESCMVNDLLVSAALSMGHAEAGFDVDGFANRM
jgi:hypothetical protein